MSRSYLFIPGDVPRMLQNLDVFEADAVIIDFEDSVAEHEKDEARNLTRTFLKRHNFDTPSIYVRINSTDVFEHCQKDIQALEDLPIEGIVLPKASLASLKVLEKLLPRPINIIGILETPEVFFEVLTLAKYPWMKGFILGAEDLTKTLNISRTVAGSELLYARSQMIFAAAAASIEAIDTPYTDVKNIPGLITDIQTSKALGATAKASIHPNHVRYINEYFTPSQVEINEAKRIVVMAEKNASMRFSLDGKMIDKPVIERAHNLLEKAKKYGVL